MRARGTGQDGRIALIQSDIWIGFPRAERVLDRLQSLIDAPRQTRMPGLLVHGASGIGLYGGTMLEGAPGTVASAHLFATFANLQWGTELFGPLLLTEEILQTPLDYSDFKLTVPSGPGLGIALDDDRVAFFARDGLRRKTTPVR